MTSKILLRIGVTIGILALIFLGVWLIWFKPSNELEVFNNLTQLQLYKIENFNTVEDNASSRTKMFLSDGKEDNARTYSFDGGNFANNGNVKDLSIQIKNYRAYMFSEFDTYGSYFFTDIVNNLNSKVATLIQENIGFDVIYGVMDNAFDYYYSYAQLAEHVSNKDVKNMNNKISTLKSSYNDFQTTYNEIVNLEKQLDDFNNYTIISEITSLYKNLYLNYFDIIKDFNTLIVNLKDFVNQYVFDGKLTLDKNVVVYDMLLNSVAEFVKEDPTLTLKSGTNKYIANNNINNSEQVNEDDNNFSKFLYDITTITLVYTYNCTENHLEQNSLKIDKEIEYYSILANEYKEALYGENNIFQLNRSEKFGLVDNDFENNESNEIKSMYKVEYVDMLRTLVNKFYQILETDLIFGGNN